MALKLYENIGQLPNEWLQMTWVQYLAMVHLGKPEKAPITDADKCQRALAYAAWAASPEGKLKLAEEAYVRRTGRRPHHHR